LVIPFVVSERSTVAGVRETRATSASSSIDERGGPSISSSNMSGSTSDAVRVGEVDRLLDAGDLDGARVVLEAVPITDEAFAVVRIRLGLMDGSMPAGAAQQALIRLMRRDPDWPGAKALYQDASSQAYQTRESSASHSHPPPPTDTGTDKGS
jgi:hypothetical protein